MQACEDEGQKAFEVLKSLSKPDLWKVIEHHARNIGITFEVAMCPSDVSANPVDKVIRGCPVRGKMTMAAMLHEIGHIATMSEDKRSQFFHLANSGGNKEFLLNEERLAWTWAKHNYPLWDNEMLERAKKALSTHVNRDGALGNRMAKEMAQELGDRVCDELSKHARQMTFEDLCGML
jgi:hypothetical protein